MSFMCVFISPSSSSSPPRPHLLGDWRDVFRGQTLCTTPPGEDKKAKHQRTLYTCFPSSSVFIFLEEAGCLAWLRPAP